MLLDLGRASADATLAPTPFANAIHCRPGWLDIAAPTRPDNPLIQRRGTRAVAGVALGSVLQLSLTNYLSRLLANDGAIFMPRLYRTSLRLRLRALGSTRMFGLPFRTGFGSRLGARFAAGCTIGIVVGGKGRHGSAREKQEK